MSKLVVNNFVEKLGIVDPTAKYPDYYNVKTHFNEGTSHSRAELMSFALNGYLPLTMYRKELIDIVSSYATYQYFYQNTPSSKTMRTASPRNVSEGEANTLAYVKAVNKLNDNLAEHSFNAALSLLEAKETMGMIANFATRTALALKSFRKLKIQEGFRILGINATPAKVKRSYNSIGIVYPKYGRQLEKLRLGTLRKADKKRMLNQMRRDNFDAASNLWLEYRYGWRLLYMDVYSAAEAAAINRDKAPFDLEVRAGGSATVERTPGEYDGQNMNGYSRTTSTQRFYLRLKIYSPTMRSLSAFGLTNPVELIWELIPFSFIFDWPLGVSSYLQRSRVREGLRVIEGTSSLKIETVYGGSVFQTPSGPLLPSTGYRYLSDAHKEVTRKLYNRTVVNSFPTQPSFSSGITWDFLNPSRLTDSIALLNGLRKRP